MDHPCVIVWGLSEIQSPNYWWYGGDYRSHTLCKHWVISSACWETKCDCKYVKARFGDCQLQF